MDRPSCACSVCWRKLFVLFVCVCVLCACPVWAKIHSYRWAVTCTRTTTCYIAKIAWRKNRRRRCRQWMNFVLRAKEMISIGIYIYRHKGFVWREIAGGTAAIAMATCRKLEHRQACFQFPKQARQSIRLTVDVAKICLQLQASLSTSHVPNVNLLSFKHSNSPVAFQCDSLRMLF